MQYIALMDIVLTYDALHRMLPVLRSDIALLDIVPTYHCLYDIYYLCYGLV